MKSHRESHQEQKPSKRTNNALSIVPILAALAGISLISAARADVKIVTAVTTAGGPTASGSGSAATDVSPKRLWITSFKGRKARREAENGHVVFLYDRDADKVYTVDTVAKTYYVESFKQALANGAGFPDAGGGHAALKVDTDLDLDAADDNSAADLTRTVAGLTGKKYALFGEISEQAPENREEGGRRSGGRGGGRRGGGGGGFPGGGFPGGGGGFPMQLQTGGGGQPRGRTMPHASLSGDLYLVDADSLLPNAKKDERELSLALLQGMLPGYSPLLDSLSGQLSKKHLLPLAGRLTLRVYNGTIAPADDGGVENASAPAVGTVPLVVSAEVTSIDEHVVLDDALFQLPAGFDRVSLPTPVAPLPNALGPRP